MGTTPLTQWQTTIASGLLDSLQQWGTGHDTPSSAFELCSDLGLYRFLRIENWPCATGDFDSRATSMCESHIISLCSVVRDHLARLICSYSEADADIEALSFEAEDILHITINILSAASVLRTSGSHEAILALQRDLSSAAATSVTAAGYEWAAEFASRFPAESSINHLWVFEVSRSAFDHERRAADRAILDLKTLLR